MSADALEYQELVDGLTIKVAGYLHLPPDTIGIDIPLADCARHGLAPASLLAREDSVAARALVADMVEWTRAMMLMIV